LNTSWGDRATSERGVPAANASDRYCEFCNRFI